MEDLCDNVDNDCDAAVDEDEVCPWRWAHERAVSTYRAVAPDDSAGFAVALGDVDGDGTVDVAIGAPQFDPFPKSEAGAVFILPYNAGLDAWMGDASVQLHGSNLPENLGGTVDFAPDATGDGRPDLVVGSPASAWTGEVRVFSDFSPGVHASSSPAALVRGDIVNQGLGEYVGLLDADGDGLSDIAAGAAPAGQVYLHLSPLPETTSAQDGALVVRSVQSLTLFGTSTTSAGDTDGDGVPEILVGSPFLDVTLANQGGAYLIAADRRGDITTNDVDALLLAENGGDEAGTMVAGVGDVNGDGLDDVAVKVDATGDAHIFYGPVPALGGLGGADVTLMPAFETEALEPANLNGDVYGDLWLGDWLGPELSDGRPMSSGSVTAFLGPLSGVVTMADAYTMIPCGYPYTDFGSALATADVDGDGLDDLLVGGFGHRTDGPHAYMFLASDL